MTRSRVPGIVVMCLVAGVLIISAAEEKSLKEALAELLPGMGAENLVDRQGPQQAWQDICFKLGAPGNEAKRAEACTLMARKLGPEIAKPARIWLLEQLRLIGRGECIDQVAAALDHKDPQVRDAARRCLAANPDSRATAVLLDRLKTAEDSTFTVGLINALGFRGDRKGAGAVAKELGNQDQTVACAAARALAKIATPRAIKALGAARPTAEGSLRMAICDAYLLCADKLTARGKAQEAMAIYKELAAAEKSRPIRLNATGGMLRAAGDEAGAMILKLVAGDDADLRAIAVGRIADLSSGGVKHLAAGSAQLAAPHQILLFDALGAKGDAAARPAVVAALDSENEEIRVAALRALGSVGTAADIPALAAQAAAGTDTEKEAARASLGRLKGGVVDAGIVAAMTGAGPDVCAVLLRSLGDRGATGRLSVVMDRVNDADAGVRVAALEALGALAGPEHTAPLIGLVTKHREGAERQAAEKSLLSVAGRGGEACVGALVAGMARSDAPTRRVLLRALARVGGARALAAVSAAVKDADAEIQNEAIRLLSDWRDPEQAAASLLSIVESAEKLSQEVAALRGYVACARRQRNKNAATKMLKEALDLAERPEEKKTVVNALRDVRTAGSLKLALSCLTDPAVVREACEAAVRIARDRNLQRRNRDLVREAMQMVLKHAPNDQAKRGARNILDRVK